MTAGRYLKDLAFWTRSWADLRASRDIEDCLRDFLARERMLERELADAMVALEDKWGSSQ
jgi:hypothetical protein